MAGGRSTAGATMMDYTQSDSDVESGKRLQSRAGAEEPLVMDQEQSDAAVATMDAHALVACMLRKSSLCVVRVAEG